MLAASMPPHPHSSRAVVVALAVILFASRSFAQAPPPEPKVWTVAASAGLALTSGNSDTSTVNAAYDLTYDPPNRNLIKSDALFIRGETEGDLTASRLGLNVRDEYALTTRAYVFGQNQYLRDEFKNIDYLVAPTGGLGYKLLDTAATKLAVDGALGVVWEKNPDVDVRTSGAIVVGEKFLQALTASTTVTQTISALWKTKDFDDSLFTFGVGLAAAMSTRTQLKVELLDTYKNKPPSLEIEKNDVAILMAIVYKR
jgi:putative salt-induced outer membrane protein YdiY